MNVTRATHGGLDIVSTILPADETPLAVHREALRVWESKRGDRLAPKWSEVELLDFPAELLRFIAMTDVADNPLRAHFRFWGSGLTDIYGRDFTGRSPSEVPPKTLGMNNQGGCARILRERRPHCQAREYVSHLGFLGRAIILRVPLSDDGVHVTHSLAFNHFESTSGDYAEFFRDIFAEIV